MKLWTVTWADIDDGSLMVDYVSAPISYKSILKILKTKILKNRSNIQYIAKNAPRAGLAKLVEYLAANGVKVGVRTTPDHEDSNRSGLTYLKGDATYPQTGNACVIPHICNDWGLWGSGFVIAVSKRWEGPERRYKATFKRSGLYLGMTQSVLVEDDKYVYNMVAQHGTISRDNPRPLSYDALYECLTSLCAFAKKNSLEVHAPKFGSDRAGGSWAIIEEMIMETLVRKGVKVFIYEYCE
jgi:hypothetical protein